LRDFPVFAPKSPPRAGFFLAGEAIQQRRLAVNRAATQVFSSGGYGITLPPLTVLCVGLAFPSTRPDWIPQQVHRVVSRWLDHRGKWVVDTGPWLGSHEDAELWAGQLRALGYLARVESIASQVQGGGADFDLQGALAGMA